MNRFDRITALWLLLQSRSVVTSRFLADHFGVSERTIYRDIRTLENAGVPIGAQAGLGYFLEKSYRLPPVCFTLDEAAALLLGEKLLVSSLDVNALGDYKKALNKVRAVIESSDQERLAEFESDIVVMPTGSQFPVDDSASKSNDATAQEAQLSTHDLRLKPWLPPASNDRWLNECRKALTHRQVIHMDYRATGKAEISSRSVEPIGLLYYSWHWHLIAWCKHRKNYRDFRLDRIASMDVTEQRFSRHDRLTLQEYLSNEHTREDLLEVELLFSTQAARFVEEQRYFFGFLSEEVQENGVQMRFMTHVPDYMARWLLQYVDEVSVLKGAPIAQRLQVYAAKLIQHLQKV